MHEQLEQSHPATGGVMPAESKTSRALRKLIRVAGDELHAIHPRYLIFQLLIALLPHNSLSRVRTLLYRGVGFEIGRGALVLGKLSLTSDGPMARMLSIGDGSRINAPFYAELNAPIVIGKRVAIGHNVVFITTDHETSNSLERAGASKFAGITIEDGAWVGARVTILPGVTIGRGSVIAAGSLVTLSVAAHKLVGGVPARVVKSLDT
ncbi:MAG TPA: acyltransferase [Steroidobacteraceae bacterium]|jgi:maltose O-acetyltransferase